MDLQQEKFSVILVELRKKYDVFDGVLPPDNTPYPFIYMGNNQTVDRPTKNVILEGVYQTIHVYHNNANSRGELSAILLDIKNTVRTLFRVRNISQQIMPDDTTSTPLLHGVLEIEFA